MTPPRIILASTSRYRAELLHRLLDDFVQVAPDVDEAVLANEAPARRAVRLATAKAAAVAAGVDDAIVIGSDQVAARGDLLLRKPSSIEKACEQLHASSSNNVDFFTCVVLIDSRDGSRHTHLDHTQVAFRNLTAAEIDRYLLREQPLDCAGSFKCEGAGIALFERIDSDDPTALIGLPLIALARMLREAGVPSP